ncbi:AAEL006202-PA [Aedes aegypti]|uniref:Odorant receptor n=2 Tax=Aedes aegypti TaxID=7159 RepID=Q177B5_AEDAE|nr:uncharacterized protein LOC5567608 [Aedes aegypti]EAT42234.1 AAEL006202-PA [Aedes aegypti]DAA80397.1 TPA_exp: odorant receptor 58 [Aedes aegypti]
MLFVIRSYLVGRFRSFHNSDNCFVIMMFCNRLIGVWDYPESDTDRFHLVKRILINFSFIYTVLEVMSLVPVVKASGVSENISSLFLVSSRVFCLAIWCSLAVYRKDLKRIFMYLLKVQQEAADDSRRKSIRYVNWFTFSFLVLNLTPLTVWIINGQAGSPISVFGHPWIEGLNIVAYPVAVFLITVMLCYAVILVLSIMSALTLEFYLLGLDFQQIFEAKPQDGNTINWTTIEQAFNRYIDRHQTLLNKADLFRELLKINFLIQLLVNFFLIVLNSFMYILMQRNESSGFAFSVFAVLTLTMNMMLNGFLCDQLEEQVSSINHRLYSSGWTDKLMHTKAFNQRYKNLRQMVLIVMQRTQKPIGFTCGSLFEMSLITCRKVLWFIYTVLAVLMSLLE